MTDPDLNGGAEARPCKPRPAQRALRLSIARLAAVQALYQKAMTGRAINVILQEFLSDRLREEVDGLTLAAMDRKLFRELVEGVVSQDDDLDSMIAALLDDDWPLERLEILLRALLKAGAYELSERPKVPARVIVSEYVDIADAFFSGREPSMVNGLLDSLARELRPDAFEPRESV